MADEEMTQKDRIVAAAFEAFLEQGYSGTGVAQVLKRAGLSKGGLYHHFDSKQSLFAAVAETYLPVPFSGADWDTLSGYDAGELKGLLVELYTEHEEAVADRDGSTLRHYSLFFDALAQLPQYRAQVDEAYEKVMDLLTAAIRIDKRASAASARQSAKLFLSALEGEAVLHAISTHLE